MTLNDIEIACRVLLDAGATFPIHYENSGDKQTGTHYQPLFLPANTETVAMSFTGVQDFSGIFQVNINIKLDTGKTDLTAALDELSGIFSRGTALNYSVTKALVEVNYSAAGISNNPWYTVPFSIEFRAIQ